MRYVHWTDAVDESKLGRTDRLALAVCRLEANKWDPILGPKPEGYDDLPGYEKLNCFTQKRKPCKFEYAIRARKAIESMIGHAAISRFYWIYGLGETEKAWFEWYVTTDHEY